METELFIVTGTSGTGKSTITPQLQQQLPNNYAVYDWDELVRSYDGTEDLWAFEVAERMFEVTRDNINQNITTVVLGLIKPAWMEKYKDQYGVKNIKFCLLTISVEERTRRLTQRGAPLHLINDLEEHEGFPQWIQESQFENVMIDTSELSPDEVTDQIKHWIEAA